MAQRVFFKTLKQPKLLQVHPLEKPFTRKDIVKLTTSCKVYALTKDGEAYYLWTESAKPKKRKKGP